MKPTEAPNMKFRARPRPTNQPYLRFSKILHGIQKVVSLSKLLYKILKTGSLSFHTFAALCEIMIADNIKRLRKKQTSVAHLGRANSKKEISLRDLDLELVAIIAMPPTHPSRKLF